MLAQFTVIIKYLNAAQMENYDYKTKNALT